MKVYALALGAHNGYVPTQTENKTWNAETLKLNDIGVKSWLTFVALDFSLINYICG